MSLDRGLTWDDHVVLKLLPTFTRCATSLSFAGLVCCLWLTMAWCILTQSMDLYSGKVVQKPKWSVV